VREPGTRLVARGAFGDERFSRGARCVAFGLCGHAPRLAGGSLEFKRLEPGGERIGAKPEPPRFAGAERARVGERRLALELVARLERGEP
jgi:hypothetical protein